MQELQIGGTRLVSGAHGEAAPAIEPVRQIEVLTGTAETDASGANQHADG
jgi:hypothetical protein